MTTPQRFLFLDGLRAVAALMVMFHHFYSLVKPTMESSYLDALFDSGRLGVPIFFVLSGFVIAYSIRNLQPFSVASRFILRRSLRLDPSYWAALSLTLMISFVIAMFMEHTHGVDFF